jgi:hypothetical protein
VVALHIIVSLCPIALCFVAASYLVGCRIPCPSASTSTSCCIALLQQNYIASSLLLFHRCCHPKLQLQPSMVTQQHHYIAIFDCCVLI